MLFSFGGGRLISTRSQTKSIAPGLLFLPSNSRSGRRRRTRRRRRRSSIKYNKGSPASPSLLRPIRTFDATAGLEYNRRDRPIRERSILLVRPDPTAARTPRPRGEPLCCDGHTNTQDKRTCFGCTCSVTPSHAHLYSSHHLRDIHT